MCSCGQKSKWKVTFVDGSVSGSLGRADALALQGQNPGSKITKAR